MMRQYKFIYKTMPIDLWQLSMYNIYGSMLGTVNIIFIIAMIILNVKFLLTAHIGLKIIMILGVCLFTIIQPLLIYLRAKKQVGLLPREIKLIFDDEYMHVDADGKTSSIPWNKIDKIYKKPTQLVIQSTTQHGFIMSNKVLGSSRDDLYAFIVSKIEDKN